MRVIFMGTTEFSKVILESLIKESYEIAAVVTQPDRPFGRKKELKAPIVKEKALEEGILVLQPEKIKDAIAEINQIEADLIVTCAYGQIVPIEILNKPKYKAVNVHASLLPKYRGGAPIHWSIIKGESKTGLTLMEMDAGMDSGNIISKREVSIELEDTMGDVEKKLMDISKDLISVDLKKYLNGEIKSYAQDDDLVSFAYTIHKKDEYIDFNRPVEDVYNHIRGLIPWPVSYANMDGKRVKFHEAKMFKLKHQHPIGKIIDISKEGMDIACIDGYVRISVIQPFGKAKMNSIDFYNGFSEEWKGKLFNQ